MRTGAARRIVALFVIVSCGLSIGTLARFASAQAAPTFPVSASSDLRLSQGRFTIVAEPKDERLARALLNSALQRDTFPGLPRPVAPVIVTIAGNVVRFRQLVGRSAPEWGAAIAVPSEQRIVMQGAVAGSDAGDPLVVLRHELAHLALHETMGALPARWFDEGFASFAAREWNRETAIEMSTGMVWHTLPTVAQLEDGFYAGETRAAWSYALAYRAVEELAALDTTNGLANFFREWKRTGSFERGVRGAYGMTGEQFDALWRRNTRRRFGALSLVTNLSVAVGFFAILLGPLFWIRRRRDRRRLDAMRFADAAQERAELERDEQERLERDERDRALLAILAGLPGPH